LVVVKKGPIHWQH